MIADWWILYVIFRLVNKCSLWYFNDIQIVKTICKKLSYGIFPQNCKLYHAINNIMQLYILYEKLFVPSKGQFYTAIFYQNIGYWITNNKSFSKSIDRLRWVFVSVLSLVILTNDSQFWDFMRTETIRQTSTLSNKAHFLRQKMLNYMNLIAPINMNVSSLNG